MPTRSGSLSLLLRDGGQTQQRPKRQNANKPSARRKNEKKQLLFDSVAELLNRQWCSDHISHSSPFHLSSERQCYRPYSSAPPSLPENEPYQSANAEPSKEEQARRSRSDGGSRPTTLVNSTGSSSNPPSNQSSRSQHEYDSDYSNQPDLSRERTQRPRTSSNMDITASDAFQDDDIRKLIIRLAAQYGHVSHMGLLDPSYRFFVNGSRAGVLSYKLQNRVAIVTGDPLCEPANFGDILHEFKIYRKRRRWGIVVMGASDVFMKYTRQRGWTAMQFGVERVLNPMDNDILMERHGKRIITQNKHLLDPQKGGISLGVYIPSVRTDPILQRELMEIYDSWRHMRSETSRGKSQAFITIYDLFCLPGLMIFIYACDTNGAAMGFAALRRIRDSRAYHLDPCVAAPWAPKGVSELLTYTSMALLNQMNISSLSFGYEPLQSLGDMMGIPSGIEKVIRHIHHYTFRRLPLAGKKAYHDKFRPDERQDAGVWLVFPGGMPGFRQVFAVAHVAHISIRKLAWPEGRRGKTRDWARKSVAENTEPG